MCGGTSGHFLMKTSHCHDSISHYRVRDTAIQTEVLLMDTLCSILCVLGVSSNQSMAFVICVYVYSLSVAGLVMSLS